MGTFNGTAEIKVNKQSKLDGYGEIIVGNGSGMAPTIKIINLDFKNHPNQINYAKVVRTINPFNSKFRGGVFFDLGRINNDAIPDLVVSTGNGGKSMVEIRNGCTGALIKSFQAYFDTTALAFPPPTTSKHRCAWRCWTSMATASPIRSPPFRGLMANPATSNSGRICSPRPWSTMCCTRTIRVSSAIISKNSCGISGLSSQQHRPLVGS